MLTNSPAIDLTPKSPEVIEVARTKQVDISNACEVLDKLSKNFEQLKKKVGLVHGGIKSLKKDGCWCRSLVKVRVRIDES